MNKVFKVIWSEARNAYVVVSEIAKNHGSKSCSTKKLLTMLIATGVMTCASMAPAMAANPASDDLNVTIGKGAHVSVWNGVSGQTISGDIAVGTNAHAWNGEYTYDNKYARIGTKEYLMDFGQGAVETVTDLYWGFIPLTHYKVADGSKIAGSIAIGKNTVARTGSVMLGDHSYTGKLGDIEINPANAMTYNDGIYSTTLGAGAYNSGSLAAVTGALSIASGEDTKNTGATIYGSLNSIESATSSSSYSGVASSVLGFANRTQNANAALVWGTGNEITNSVEEIGIDTNWNNVSVAEAGKHTTLSNGKNTTVEAAVKDGQTNYKVNVAGDLTDISSVANGDAKLALNGAAGTAAIINGQGASVFMMNGSTTINGVVGIDNTGKISGVANGEADKDAVNYGQLKDVKAEALKHSTVTNGDNIAVTETTNKDGGKEYKVALNNDIHLFGDNGAMVSISGSHGTIWTSGSVTAGSVVAGDVVMDSTTATVSGLSNKTTAYEGFATTGKAATEEQLKEVAIEAGKHSKVVNGSNINVEEFDNDGQKIYKVNLNKDIMLGDLTGKYVSISGTNGTIETTGYIATQDRVYADKGAKLADIDVTGNKISNGASSIVLDGNNVKVNDKVTIDQNGKISGVAAGEISSTSTDAINGSQLHQTNENVAANRADIDKNKADIAALDNRVTQNEQNIAQNAADIAQNKADIAANRTDIDKNAADIAQNKTDIKNLNTRVDNVEELAKKHTTVTAGDNMVVTETTNKDGGKEYNVALDKNITVDSVKAGDTTISDKGLEIKDGPSVTKDGIYAGDKKITGVADGKVEKDSKDAINGGQLHQAKADINNRIDGVENQVVNNTNRINKLGSRVNKVGAGAAALAALHPMDFDPDDKLTFSAGYGNYAGENAAAIGAYYRPDEKVMFSVAGTVGNGENMVNAGVSFALDRTNHVSNSRTALAREVIDLRGQLAVMGAKMAKMEKAFGMLDETKTKLFPDVPANHWAYEYIAKLAGNGYIEGYPDGNFGGDRLMTRYEFAAMLYRAIENGAALEEKIIKEFEPELGRIRVDRISGEDGDRDKIERVRVNDTKGERDHYGNKLAK